MYNISFFNWMHIEMSYQIAKKAAFLREDIQTHSTYKHIFTAR